MKRRSLVRVAAPVVFRLPGTRFDPPVYRVVVQAGRAHRWLLVLPIPPQSSRLRAVPWELAAHRLCRWHLAPYSRAWLAGLSKG